MIIIIIRSESYLSLLKSAVKIEHDRSPGSHYEMYFKFILKNTRRSSFLPFCSTIARFRSPHTLNKRSGYACDAGAEIRSVAILDRSGYLNTSMLQELEPLQRHACFRRAVGQSPQCRAFRELLSALLSFSFCIFSFSFFYYFFWFYFRFSFH